MSMDITTGIRKLRSVRAYADRPIPAETLREILDAGRRAQSSKNSQPWQFVVVQERERLQQLAQTGTFASHVADAAALIVLATQQANAYDIGQATAFLQLAALERGVGSCIVVLHEADDARAVLGMPADWSPFYALALGYAAEDWQPTKMGGRRSLDDVVRWEQWSTPGADAE